jgi:hypothetical protein
LFRVSVSVSPACVGIPIRFIHSFIPVVPGQLSLSGDVVSPWKGYSSPRLVDAWINQINVGSIQLSHKRVDPSAAGRLYLAIFLIAVSTPQLTSNSVESILSRSSLVRPLKPPPVTRHRATHRMSAEDNVADAWSHPSGLPMGDEEAEAMAASVMPGISSSEPSSPTTKTKKKRGKKKITYKKNPYAPKRFKSSYICYFTSIRPDIKKELKEALGRDPTVSLPHATLDRTEYQ